MFSEKQGVDVVPLELHETLQRIFTLIRYLHEHPGASYTEISRSLGIGIDTVRKLLRALEQVGLVYREVGGMPRTARNYLTELGKCIAECVSRSSQ